MDGAPRRGRGGPWFLRVGLTGVAAAQRRGRGHASAPTPAGQTRTADLGQAPAEGNLGSRPEAGVAQGSSDESGALPGRGAGVPHRGSDPGDQLARRGGVS